MYKITSGEINEGWGYVWDCLVEACHHNNELNAILDNACKVPLANQIALITELINEILDDNAIRLVSIWGFSDTPARDEMYLSFEAKIDQLKPYLQKYLGG